MRHSDVSGSSWLWSSFCWVRSWLFSRRTAHIALYGSPTVFTRSMQFITSQLRKATTSTTATPTRPDDIALTEFYPAWVLMSMRLISMSQEHRFLICLQRRGFWSRWQLSVRKRSSMLDKSVTTPSCHVATASVVRCLISVAMRLRKDFLDVLICFWTSQIDVDWTDMAWSC